MGFIKYRSRKFRSTFKKLWYTLNDAFPQDLHNPSFVLEGRWLMSGTRGGNGDYRKGSGWKLFANGLKLPFQVRVTIEFSLFVTTHPWFLNLVLNSFRSIMHCDNKELSLGKVQRMLETTSVLFITNSNLK